MPPSVSSETKNTFIRDRKFSQPSTDKGKPLRNLLMLVLVLLLALGSLKAFNSGKHSASETVQVVAANFDLAPGSKLAFTSLHYLSLPRSYFNESMFTSYAQLAGKVTSTYIRKGEPISKGSLLSVGSISEMLLPGERAITLKLDPEMLVDYGTHCGDRVDIVVSSSSEGKRFTRTVCQNLKVLLSVPKEMLSSPNLRGGDTGRITLAASGADCEKLNQAADTGKIRLLLKSRALSSDEQLSGSDERDILPPFALKPEPAQTQQAQYPFAPLTPPPPPAYAAASTTAEQEAAPAPVQWLVEMFSGSKKESYAVPQH